MKRAAAKGDPSAGGQASAAVDRLRELVETMNAEMQKVISLDRIEICFHPGRGASDCDCRKPKPGMLLHAAKELGIDLAQSWMPATPAEQILSEENGARVIRASVAIDATPQLILRLRITRP